MPPKKKSEKSVKEVSAHVHKQARRKNIPTAELQDFVKDDETKPREMRCLRFMMYKINKELNQMKRLRQLNVGYRKALCFDKLFVSDDRPERCRD